MGSSRLDSRHWYSQVLKELMAEKGMTIAKLSYRVDCPDFLIAAILDGSHNPSIATAERLLNGLGYEFEVIPVVKNDARA